ncbi:MAG: N-acetyl sugar amidotransferase [Parvicella sp.]|jgi:N-acetyl sugar amidotransferase
MNQYQVCTRCVMDTSASDIEFNEDGVCSVCQEAERILPNLKFTEAEGNLNLEQLFKGVKKSGKKYDSILGLSGGVDSSYVALLAKRMGLNPLAVHFDNGWNSELAISNIEKIVNKCGFDLQTYVINWQEFKDLQRSFLKAGVIDIELLTDHAIFASLFQIRRKYGIKYVLSGTNYSTEHGMPESWTWLKTDKSNILDIHSKYGERKIKSYPMMNTIRWKFISKLGVGGTFLEPLNVIDYSKNEAMKELEKEFGWKYYGGKHYESVFTKFYQAHILPNKFKIDKRRVHLSALIRNGEITRDAGLKELDKPLYDETELKAEREYVLKKLAFTDLEFGEIMERKPVSHDEFKNEQWVIKLLGKLRKKLNKKSSIEMLSEGGQ